MESTTVNINKKKLNDIDILNELKTSCYDSNDVRACWIADYLLDTDIQEFKNYARWSLQHWNMYKGFLKHIRVNDCNNILDAACGNGFNTKMLAYEIPNSKIIGIDMNKNIIDLAIKYNTHPNIQYICDDLLNYTTNTKFKYIFFLEILEHIRFEHHYTIIDKLLDLLTDDGLLFISTPNELDNPDCHSEHIGLMNRERTLKFINKYKNNFVNTEFFDNTKLDSENFIIEESIETYQHSSSGIGGVSTAPNKSHFKIVLRVATFATWSRKWAMRLGTKLSACLNNSHCIFRSRRKVYPALEHKSEIMMAARQAAGHHQRVDGCA